MDYIISRGFKLLDSAVEMEKRLFFNLWRSALWPYRELSEGDRLYWYETPSAAIVWKSRVRKIIRFPYGAKTEVAAKLRPDGGNISTDPYFVNAPGSGFCLAYKIEELERVELPKPEGFRFPQQGWMKSDSEIAKKWLREGRDGIKEMATAALSLKLHDRYGRREAFGSVGVDYAQQNRSLNTGLSPELPDGGFFIFVTLDKEGFDPRHDYEDEIFADRFIWVTRRGRGESHPDYVKLRQSATRVSLFIRTDSNDKFLYAGELRYETHRELSDPSTGEVQQSYTWRLKIPLPETLIRELAGDRVQAKPKPSKHPGGKQRTRKPSSFDEYRKALSYALGSLERKLVPGHHNYQVRLKRFLTGKGIAAEFEKDFVDVSFDLGNEKFIGEIKVTSFMGLNQAFRVALGQLLEYANLRFKVAPNMVMFLDGDPDSSRVGLASKFMISVVVESDDGNFTLLNPGVIPALGQVFSIKDR